MIPNENMKKGVVLLSLLFLIGIFSISSQLISAYTCTTPGASCTNDQRSLSEMLSYFGSGCSGTVTRGSGTCGSSTWCGIGNCCHSYFCNGNLINSYGDIPAPVCTPTTEICNSVDDDCDGSINEGNVCNNISFVPNGVGFAGMYTRQLNVGTCLYSNPATGGCSCPSGYKVYHSIGGSYSATQNDDEVYYCYNASKQGIYEFGGVYGYAWNCTGLPAGTCGTCTVLNKVNKITGTFGCPIGFTSVQIRGRDSVDNSMWFCYKTLGSIYNYSVAGGASFVNSSCTDTQNDSCGPWGNSFPNILGGKRCPGDNATNIEVKYTWVQSPGACNFDVGDTFCVCTKGSCSGKQCGTDGCGLSCGTCSGGYVCSEEQTCVNDTSIRTTTWKNLNGENISSANINDTVLMYVPGENLLNKLINYTIYEKRSLFGIDWLWSDYRLAQSASYGYSIFKLNQTNTPLYFFARIEVDNIENQSNDLDVDGVNDFRPLVKITSPNNYYLTSVNYSINFTHSSSDEDDLLKLTWDFGDGTNESYYNYSLGLTSGLGNTKNNYSTGGIYTVTLTASEMTRDKKTSDSKLIYVLKPGINVVPVITSPFADQNYSGWINFNASQSFVANCSLSEISNYNFIAGDLYCKYIHAPGTKITTDYNINLTWTVKELDGSVVAGFPISNSWNNYFYVVDFQRLFISAAKRSAFLSMEYSN